ncbi:MAG: hypothetical protein AAFX58_03580 [Pseudomonadota bacterium]
MPQIPCIAVIAALGVAAFWAWRQFSGDKAVETPDGYRYQGYTIEPQQPYRMEARVLARKEYRSGRESDLSPLDLALGWGPMARPDVLARIDISQRGRFYWWRTAEFPIPRRDIETNSANVHIIPATPNVRERLGDIAPDMNVRLTGQLVHVQADDGWRWQSSLTFEDTGRGACELLWLEQVDIL